MIGRPLLAPSVGLWAFLTLAGCASLPENVERPASYAFADTYSTVLGQANVARQLEYPGKTAFYLLSNGLDAFVARAVLAQYAERSIDAQYYILHNDLTGRLFVDQLLKAADRGVRVRLLLDDLDAGDKDLPLAAVDRHPNVEIRVFNPFARSAIRATQFVTRLNEVGRRMHSKSFTVDNQYAIVGGRNIGNEYFEADPEIDYTDLDVVAAGPLARTVSTAFDEYWNSPLAYPISALVATPPTPQEVEDLRVRLAEFVEEQTDSPYLRALQNSKIANELRKGKLDYQEAAGEILYDPPEKLLEERGKSERYVTWQLGRHLDEVREELIIFSPYFVPGNDGVAYLRAMCERGYA
jgi:putative cardiolipin synthase